MKAALLLLAAAWAAVGADYPFSLRPERARYLAGEPVYLRMAGAHAKPPALEEKAVVLLIRDPAGSEHAYRPPLVFRANTASRDTSHARYARLIAENGGLVFPRPGRYRLRLVAPASDAPAAAGLSRETPALSDTVSIEVASPTGAADRRAFGIISRNGGEYALALYLEGGDQLKQGMAILRALASFPNAYSRAASLVLCSDWSQDYLARGGGTPRRLDLDSALAHAVWDKDQGRYAALRTAFRIRNAVALDSARSPSDPALARARARLHAFEDSLTGDERALLASF